MLYPFGMRVLLLLGALSVTTHAAAPKKDSVDQLFRRAPMPQASRTVVVKSSTNLHIAFDTDLARVHTVWRGGGLNLFGPPYHGGKSPFLCTVDGEVLWSFPGISPWLADEQAAKKIEYRGFKIVNSQLQFIYDLSFAPDEKVRLTEIPRVAEVEGNPVFSRRFRMAPSAHAVKFLAQAELGAAITLEGPGIRIVSGTNTFLLIARGQGIRWDAVEEQVDYDYEIITEEGTEKGNPRQKRRGLEARAYAIIPAHEHEIEFEIITTCGKTRVDALAAIPPIASSQSKIFASAPTHRKNSGDESYRIEHFPVPPEIQLLVTGMDWLPNGDLAVCTWIGEIYIVENPTGSVEQARYRRFARGLNEPLGLTVRDGKIYVVQKGELTRITDSDANGDADLFECVNDDWGYSGNYHSYSFGPTIDPAGNFLVFITGQRGRWDLPFQGWALRISPDGERLEPIAHGLRAPNGHGFHRGDLFVVDNQGNWVGACKLSHIVPGKFYGFPSSIPAPKDQRHSWDEVEKPAVWFPRSLAPSSSGMETISDERFGPFHGQLLVGDFQNAIVTRVFLEKVNSRWQGAVFPFAKGFLSGANRLRMGRDGKLYVGGIKRTWSNVAPLEYSLDRLSFTGTTPFEVKEVRALADGFEFVFTAPVNSEDAADPENYGVSQFTYKYHEEYGSPEFDHEGKVGTTPIPITTAAVSSDGLRVKLKMDGLRQGYVTAFKLPLITSKQGDDLRQDTFWYTLNQSAGSAGESLNR